MLLQFVPFFSLFMGYTAGKEVVCYVPTWTPDALNKIDTSLCTMFMIAFGSVNAKGVVKLPSNLASFKHLRTSTSKLILSIGGGSAGPAAFKKIAASASIRKTFNQNCLNAVKNNGLDGIDIDWEFPDSVDKANFVTLHKELKTALGSGYLVSSAVSGADWEVKTNKIYDIPGLSAAIDFIHLMTYDMHMDESWDSSFGVNYNAPIFANSGDSVDKAVNNWIQGGAPAAKLTLGVPFYGRQYVLTNAKQHTPKSPFDVGHQTDEETYMPGYNMYCSRLSDSTWTKVFDSAAQVPYMYKGNQWLSYDDSNSITIKGQLAKKYNLGGVMLWSIDQDDYAGVCSSCKFKLLKALNAAIGRGQACP